jgi:predicted anti-sigma-YlaC factor YlaD
LTVDCRDIREAVLRLDRHEVLTQEIADHLHVCPTCRDFTSRIAESIDAALLPDDITPDAALTDRVMASVRVEADRRGRDIVGEPDDPPFALRGWLVVGGMLVLGAAIVQFSETLRSLRVSMGPRVDVALSLASGLVLTVYICVFVVSHHAGISRWFDDVFRSNGGFFGSGGFFRPRH